MSEEVKNKDILDAFLKGYQSGYCKGYTDNEVGIPYGPESQKSMIKSGMLEAEPYINKLYESDEVLTFTWTTRLGESKGGCQ